jgi:hypothetical protein
MKYLYVAHSPALLQWLLLFLPGSITVLTSWYSELCPAVHADLISHLSSQHEVL